MKPGGPSDMKSYSAQYSLSAYYVGGAADTKMIPTICSLKKNSQSSGEEGHLILSPEKSLPAGSYQFLRGWRNKNES